MSRWLAVALLAVPALAQNSTMATTSTSAALPSYTSGTPLVAKRYTYPNLPYQVDTDSGERGSQSGYNICNSTTEGPSSLCQTAFINSIDDFCLWGPQELGLVGDLEGEMVAYCTKAGKGTRQIPPGALKGVQFMKTPHYVQITGFIDQTQINVTSGDTGGEMDPHGADNRGNPLGGLLFTNHFGSNTDNASFTQAVEWHNFLGADRFCLKACDPAWDGASRMCEHIYDRIGCAYNAPAAYVNGTFETCLGDDQLPPGIYVGTDNITSTYTQPAESLGVISTIPYVAAIPASSSCTPFASNQLYSTVRIVDFGDPLEHRNEWRTYFDLVRSCLDWGLQYALRNGHDVLTRGDDHLWSVASFRRTGACLRIRIVSRSNSFDSMLSPAATSVAPESPFDGYSSIYDDYGLDSDSPVPNEIVVELPSQRTTQPWDERGKTGLYGGGGRGADDKETGWNTNFVVERKPVMSPIQQDRERRGSNRKQVNEEEYDQAERRRSSGASSDRVRVPVSIAPTTFNAAAGHFPDPYADAPHPASRGRRPSASSGAPRARIATRAPVNPSDRHSAPAHSDQLYIPSETQPPLPASVIRPNSVAAPGHRKPSAPATLETPVESPSSTPASPSTEPTKRRKSMPQFSMSLKWGSRKKQPVISNPILPTGFVESLGMETFDLTPGCQPPSHASPVITKKENSLAPPPARPKRHSPRVSSPSSSYSTTRTPLDTRDDVVNASDSHRYSSASGSTTSAPSTISPAEKERRQYYKELQPKFDTAPLQTTRRASVAPASSQVNHQRRGSTSAAKYFAQEIEERSQQPPIHRPSGEFRDPWGKTRPSFADSERSVDFDPYANSRNQHSDQIMDRSFSNQSSYSENHVAPSEVSAYETSPEVEPFSYSSLADSYRLDSPNDFMSPMTTQSAAGLSYPGISNKYHSSAPTHLRQQSMPFNAGVGAAPSRPVVNLGESGLFRNPFQ
ncbi:hypothetical protein MNV49_000602 [Pseudohyphozyma bogoriensis]|nr:hypothetical protein MNV49_000602 [Pseudohyphozyma bogoriensis]